MSPETIGILGLLGMFLLMILGMPISFSMIVSGFVGIMAIIGYLPASSYLAQIPFNYVANYTFSVLPLFVLMGNLAYHSGLTEAAYSTARKWIGNWPGGLAIATIGGCAGFAATCGSSMACALGMTKVAYPELKDQGYDPRISLGGIAAGGTLGILIPPSTGFIIYGIYSEQSIGRLFLAGIAPGLILTALFIMAVLIRIHFNPSLAPRAPKNTWKEKMDSIKNIWGIALLIVLIMGGIWAGIFTATEASGIGAFGALVIALVKRRISLRIFIESLKDTSKTTASVFLIIIGAMFMTSFFALSNLPTHLANMVADLAVPPIGVIIAIIITYTILGSIMDTVPMTFLTLPIFIPIVSSLGYDLIWFGVIQVIMCEMGLINPPVGMNVFVISGVVQDVPMSTIFRGVWPFVLAMFVCIVLLVLFPQIALFIPNSLMN